jgi:ssDNA-binding Zn-finger/Zn-ribbon topoisomerase 1
MGRKGKAIMATEAYCVKCREKREMKDEKEVTMKNGRPALEGICPVCGTKLFRLKSTKKAAAS